MVDATLGKGGEEHPTISGFKRGAVEGGSKSVIEELESKAARVAGEEMADFKKAVEKDPSLLDKAGQNTTAFIKNLEGVSSEKEFNTEA